ncbi:MAG: hypothetical protein ACK4OJ_15195, partial [Brevundimonas sp.]
MTQATLKPPMQQPVAFIDPNRLKPSHASTSRPLQQQQQQRVATAAAPTSLQKPTPVISTSAVASSKPVAS